MEKNLLSIDWDYFIDMPDSSVASYTESKKTIIDLWYKRYIKLSSDGKNIRKLFRLSSNASCFWEKTDKIFHINQHTPCFVSDSHALSYEIAKKSGCQNVYLFDAHSDLGYGGPASLNFEVNCANWLGKLLKDNLIIESNIIYSSFTKEKPEYFNFMNWRYPIHYWKPDDLEPVIDISAVHICRSGAWTPPWLDESFLHFTEESGLSCLFIDCPKRIWDPEHISFSDQIFYQLA